MLIFPPCPTASWSRAFLPGRSTPPPAVAERLVEEDLHRILHRHHCGDWGDLGDGDKRANEEALRSDERILSRYDLECGSFCIVT
jgi:hypothetical protein